MRRLGNVLIAVLAWFVFAFMWWFVFQHLGPAPNQIRSIVLVVVVALLVVMATRLWITWNVRLWRRGNRRIASTAAGHDYSIDVAGRPVDADFASLRAMRYVVIDIEEVDGAARKRYSTPDDQQPTEDEVAACEL